MYNLYKSNKADTSRFYLGNIADKNIFVIGLNPSTADKEKSDTTVAKVEKAAAINHYNGFVMLNLYPLRSTDPKELPASKDKALFDKNINLITKLINDNNNPVIWAAWGDDINLRSYLTESLKAIIDKTTNTSWVNYGTLTVKGNPRHPSRLTYKSSFNKFNANAYATKIA